MLTNRDCVSNAPLANSPLNNASHLLLPADSAIPVNETLIEEMLAHMVRCEQVFLVARGSVEPDHFNGAGESGYRLVWFAVLRLYERNGRLPGYEILSAEVLPLLEQDPMIPEIISENTQELLAWMWGETHPDNVWEPLAAVEWIKAFLVQRNVSQKLAQSVTSAQTVGGYIAELPSLLGELQKEYDRIQAMSVGTSIATAPDEWEASTAMLIPTGVTMFDERMDGGSETGDVNCLLGPTGVGKTMTGMQLLVANAKQQIAKEARGEEPRLNVYISYEDNTRSMRIRAMCFAAEIDKTRLERMQSYRELSTTGNLLEYEARRFADKQEKPGELERLQAARPWLNKYTRFADFSGSRTAGQPPRGNGGVDEIRYTLDSYQQAAQMPLGMVVIDWAGMAVRRHLRATGKDVDRHQVSALTDYISLIRDQITAPFNCVGWVLHQLKGQANNYSPTRLPHHSNAEWCASFAVNAWFAFVLGTKDITSNACLLGCTKTRRGEGQASVLCKIDGAFGQLVDASNELRIDQASRRFLSRREADSLQPPTVNQAISQQNRVAENDFEGFFWNRPDRHHPTP